MTRRLLLLLFILCDEQATPYRGLGMELFSVDFPGEKPEPLCFYIAEIANHHVQQSDPRLFTYDPIGSANNQLATMVTNSVHRLFLRRKQGAIVRGKK